MLNRQMELGFGNVRANHSPHHRRARRVRAQWWFDQMRQVVNRALDWEPAPEPRPTQIWLEASAGTAHRTGDAGRS
jgi:hypothetical protein